MSRFKADLHLHSTISDGSLSAEKMIACAQRLGMQVLSFVEHDTMQDFPAAEEAAARHGIRLIPGVELSAKCPQTGRKMHILGYGILDPQMIERACAEILTQRNCAAQTMITELALLGYPITYDDIATYSGEAGVIYRQHIIHALCDRGYETVIYGELYKKYYGTVLKSDLPEFDAIEAIRLIREAGGLAVLAHPYQYDSIEAIQTLVAQGLLGLEAYYPDHTEEQRTALVAIAQQYSLFLTGGSDAHGLYSAKSWPIGCVDFAIEKTHPLMQTTRR